jgi:class 3 adenylate cyclase/pimeloyl-ACP methyl ester carboxylesterase
MPAVHRFGSTRYARRGDVHLAYRMAEGDGPDVVMPMPGFFPLSGINDAYARRFFERAAGLGRVVLFERRGIGESDPIDPAHAPSLDDEITDVLAVMDCVGMERPAIYGYYNCGAIALHLAAQHPARVSKLAIVQSFVCWNSRSDLQGVEEHYRQSFAHEVEHGPGADIDMLSIVAPTKAHDAEFRRWWDDIGRRGASPRSALALGQAQDTWDVTSDLGEVGTPTIIVHRTENRFIPVSHARYLAATLTNARLVEVPGADFLGFLGDVDSLFDEPERFIAGRPPRGKRSLATVLFTDLVDSTSRSVREGDRAWSTLLVEHDQIVAEAVGSYGGQVIKSTGDGGLAIFTAPGSAVRAAWEVQRRLAPRELRLRAGIHTGEIEHIGTDITGIAVTIAARVMAHADADEVLVSGAVPPLVVGSGLEFDSRGTVELKGVPGRWTLWSCRRTGDPGRG